MAPCQRSQARLPRGAGRRHPLVRTHLIPAETRNNTLTSGVSCMLKKACAMPRPSKMQSLPFKLAGHLAMGGLLGTALAVSLIVMNARNVLDLIALSASPLMTGMVFVSVFALFCAVGATLTGLIFILAEEDKT